MSATGDLLAGIKTKWNATSGITNIIPTASLYLGSTKSGLTFPYCVVTVTKNGDRIEPAPQISGVSKYVCFRRAKFDVYHSTAELADAAIDAIIAGFNSNFAISNSAHIEWSADDEPDSAVEQEPRDGTPCYMASAEFVSIIQRDTP